MHFMVGTGNLGKAALTDYLLKGGWMRRSLAKGARRPQDLRFNNDDDDRGFLRCCTLKIA